MVYSLSERMRLKRKNDGYSHWPAFKLNMIIISILMKNVPIFADLAMSQCWSAIFCATGVLGGKPIGCVRVNFVSCRLKFHMLKSLTNDGPVILTHLRKYQPLREITTSSHTEFHHQRSRPNVARDTGATKCGSPKDKFSVNSKKV